MDVWNEGMLTEATDAHGYRSCDELCHSTEDDELRVAQAREPCCESERYGQAIRQTDDPEGFAQSLQSLPNTSQANVTHASRTTSGSNRCLSSFPFKSLQHSPFRDRLCLSHFVSMPRSGMLSFKEGGFEFITESSGIDSSQKLIIIPFGRGPGRVCLRCGRCNWMDSECPGMGGIDF